MITFENIYHANETIKKIWDEYQLSPDFFYHNIDLITKFLNSQQKCTSSSDKLEDCQQEIPGYAYTLTFHNILLQLSLTDCNHRKAIQQSIAHKNNFLIQDYPVQFLNKTFKEDFFIKKERKYFLQYFKKMQEQLETATSSIKGCFLQGNSGTGKSFIFMLLSNHLIRHNKTVCFINWPDFIMRLKSNFKTENNYQNEMLEKIKACDMLFLDDVGGETVSVWTRDELLFSILDYRNLQEKTTFINSIYNYDQLYMRYLRVAAVDNSDIKTRKLLQRVTNLTEFIALTPEK